MLDVLPVWTVSKISATSFNSFADLRIFLYQSKRVQSTDVLGGGQCGLWDFNGWQCEEVWELGECCCKRVHKNENHRLFIIIALNKISVTSKRHFI